MRRLKKEIPAIATDRLRLISMTVECLRAIHDGNIGSAEAEGGFAIARNCSLSGKAWVEHRLEMIERDPGQHPWMYRAIVRKSDKVMVGYISFHHKAPDPDLLEHSKCGVELGYTIEPQYRRQGYAKESALAMMEWAYRHKVGDFFLSISPDNIPSLKLAESMGFGKIGERMDEIDGIEYLFRAAIDDIRRHR